MATQPVGQVISPGFDEEEVVTGGTLSAIEEADRSSMVATAKKFPRSLTRFAQELTEIAQMNSAVAKEMMYSIPRAGKQLIGPSVRFAEALISCWGNSRVGVEVVDVDKDSITAEGRFYDCEKNVGIAVRVRRRITDKNGQRFNADMIGVTGAAASSIALRGAILRGVPKALWADKFEMAKQTAVGDIKSMDAVKQQLMGYFTGVGVTEVEVLNALGVQGMPDIGAEEILAMHAWQKQLKAGESSREDIFGSPEDAEIEKIMAALAWNETKKRTSRESFKGRRSEHLEYLRAQATKSGQVVTMASKEAPAANPTNSTKNPSASTSESHAKTSSPTSSAAHADEAAKPQAKPTAAAVEVDDNF